MSEPIHGSAPFPLTVASVQGFVLHQILDAEEQ